MNAPRCPECGAALFAQTYFLVRHKDGTLWLNAPLMPHTCEERKAS
jgi:hypothetical protein